MLIVVRHAEAGRKGGWDGPDLLRPLSPDGRDQAEGLVVRLEDDPVEHWPKGSAWLLWRTGRRVHARYLAPLALDHRTFAS